MSKHSLTDPWSRTLESLVAASQRSPSRLNESARKIGFLARSSGRRWDPVSEPCGADRCVTVDLVERLGNRTITVNWRDATSCCYSDQRWLASVARADGVCALSGSAISKGDAIFRPQSGRLPPTNARAMMLVHAVDAILPAPDAGFAQLIPL
jgi:hypothetical protein